VEAVDVPPNRIGPTSRQGISSNRGRESSRRGVTADVVDLSEALTPPGNHAPSAPYCRLDAKAERKTNDYGKK
jgi:hypothetical protein